MSCVCLPLSTCIYISPHLPISPYINLCIYLSVYPLFIYLRVPTCLPPSPPFQIRVIRAFQSGLVEPMDLEEDMRRPRGGIARWGRRLRPASVSESASLDILVDPEGGGTGSGGIPSASLPEVEGSR